jgi:hypothetical protein
MRNGRQYLRYDASTRCAVCDGKFALVRYHAWQTFLCSRKCSDRFKARQDDDRRWIGRFQSV